MKIDQPIDTLLSTGAEAFRVLTGGLRFAGPYRFSSVTFKVLGRRADGGFGPNAKIQPTRAATRWLPWLLAGWLVAGQAVAAGLPTVVGTNVCADLLLLNIASPRQILSLSRQSRDSGWPWLTQAAAAYPSNRGSVEELLALKPDIALVYRGWAGRRHAELLARQGIRVIAVSYPGDWDDALEAARAVGAEIGRGTEAAAVAASAAARMDALAATPRGQHVLYLRPNGGTAGQGTYVDDVLRRLGLRNLAAEQGIRGWGRFPLERLVADRPEVFLLGYFDRPLALSGSAFGRHPLFRRLLDGARSIQVPAGAWGCGGLELVQAAEQIAVAIHRLNVSAP